MNNFVCESIRFFEKNCYQYGARDLFHDFVMYYANKSKAAIYDPELKFYREYQQIEKKYDKKILDAFKIFFEKLVKALDIHAEDYLGQIYMLIGIANKKGLGQCFTPTPISDLMAQIALLNHDFENEKKPIHISDPCCGGGSLLMGAINQLRKQEINYAQNVIIEAQDLDYFPAHMCYLQLNLVGAAAIVNIGNTLTMEIREQMPTLAYAMQLLLREAKTS